MFNFFYKIIDCRRKSLAFVAISQVVSAYIQNHNWSGLKVIEITNLQKIKLKIKMAAIFLKKK